MQNRLYDVAGIAGSIGVALVWVLLGFAHVGGLPVFLSCAVGALGCGLFCLHLQRQTDLFVLKRELLLATLPWLMGIASLPLALVAYFPLLVAGA